MFLLFTIQNFSHSSPKHRAFGEEAFLIARQEKSSVKASVRKCLFWAGIQKMEQISHSIFGYPFIIL
jgi:hypothetical protein